MLGTAKTGKRLLRYNSLGRLRDPPLACFVPWDSIGASRRLDVPQLGPKAPARPGLSFRRCVGLRAAPHLTHRTKCQATALDQLAMAGRPAGRGKSRPVAPGGPGRLDQLAEFILKAAAEGVTSYEGLMAAVISQLPTILSMFS